MDILNPLDFPEWDKLVLASPNHSFFHTSFWARVLHDSYNYRPCYLTEIQNGAVKTLVPLMEINSFLTGKRGVSLPFTDYCEPIIADHGTVRDILEFLQVYGEKEEWKHWELRGGERYWNKVPSSSSYYRHVLKLSKDVDAVYAHVQKGRKSNITKAIREGVTITKSDTINSVKEYYRLHCLTRKKHGTPPQPFSFFQRLHEHIISTGHGQVILAVYQGKTIAGAVNLHFGNEAIYKYGASDSTYQHLRPTDLLMWEAIQYYCSNGYGKYCFGRTEPNNEGLRNFKKGWGTEETVIRYFKYDVSRKEFKTEEAPHAAISPMIFRRMPIFLSTMVGKALYRHVG